MMMIVCCDEMKQTRQNRNTLRFDSKFQRLYSLSRSLILVERILATINCLFVCPLGQQNIFHKNEIIRNSEQSGVASDQLHAVTYNSH